MKPIPIFVHGRFAGTVDGVVFKIERSYFHIFHKFDSINISVEALRQAIQHAKYIECEFLNENKTKEFFEVPITLYIESELKHDNNGDLQYCVPLEKLRVETIEWY